MPRSTRSIILLVVTAVVLFLFSSSARVSFSGSGTAKEWTWTQPLQRPNDECLTREEWENVEIIEKHVHPPPVPSKVVTGDHEASIVSSQRPKPTTSPPKTFYEQLAELYPYSTEVKRYGDDTLGVFQKIWVVSLENRQDRKEHMKTLAHALGNLSFTYHPARDPFHNELDRKVVEDTINYVLYEREKAAYDTRSRPNGEQGRKKAFKFEWSEDAKIGTSLPLAESSLLDADFWLLPSSDPRKPRLPDTFKRLQLNPTGESVSSSSRPAPQIVYDDSEIWDSQEWNAMDPAKVGCWWSHYEILRKIAEESQDDGPHLILEDDVDFEFDIQKRLLTLFEHLPGWDVLFLGHCYSDGPKQAPIPGTPHLRRPSSAMCTHAYAITPPAARRLVRYLRSPLFAFSRPIDHIHNIPQLIPGFGKFSVEPPIVVQLPKGEMKSDVGTTEDETNRQWLVDSTVSRIRRVLGK
ncbi:hypothetical protein DL96DRAFT_1523361 [Flagelloscypha sp. PMI_526]|nr:hypothetical protein DL96DRAFT_1523361 [Flagelloscypha sp. PMI_526]